MRALNEEAEIRRIVLQAARHCFTHVMRQWGATRAGNPRHVVDRLDPGLRGGHVAISRHREASKSNGLVLRETFWGPAQTQPIISPWRSTSEPNGTRQVKIIENFSGEPLPIDLRKELSEEITEQFEIAVGLSTSATSTTTAEGGGAFGGVSQEFSLTLETTLNTNKETGSANTLTEESAAHLTVPPGRKQTFSYQPVIVHSERTIEGPRFLDFSFQLDFEDWAFEAFCGGMVWDRRAGETNVVGGRHGKSRMDFESVQHFLDCCHGLDYRWARDAHGAPKLRDFLRSCGRQAREGVEWLEDPANRMITEKAIEHQRSEDAEEIELDEDILVGA